MCLLIVESGNVLIRVHDLDRARSLDITCGDHACTLHVQMHLDRTVCIATETYLFQIEHDVGHVLLDMRNVLKLVLHTCHHQRDDGCTW